MGKNLLLFILVVCTIVAVVLLSLKHREDAETRVELTEQQPRERTVLSPRIGLQHIDRSDSNFVVVF